MLKKISKSSHPDEVAITRMFSEPELVKDRRNHCVRLHEVLQLPDDEDKVLLVLPLLRKFDNPRMETVGEAVEFLRQVFEVSKFLCLITPPLKICIPQRVYNS